MGNSCFDGCCSSEGKIGSLTVMSSSEVLTEIIRDDLDWISLDDLAGTNNTWVKVLKIDELRHATFTTPKRSLILFRAGGTMMKVNSDRATLPMSALAATTPLAVRMVRNFSSFLMRRKAKRDCLAIMGRTDQLLIWISPSLCR